MVNCQMKGQIKQCKLKCSLRSPILTVSNFWENDFGVFC